MKKDFIVGLITGLIIMILVVILYIGSNNLVEYLNLSGIYLGNQQEQELEVEDKFNILVQYLDRYYYEEINTEDLIENAFKGMLEGIGDPYTVYYNEEEYRRLLESTEGVYSGIGVVVTYDEENSQIRVLSPFIGSPGEKAGLLPDDIILEVDGISVEGMNLEEAVGLITGEEGTEVVLTIYRESEEREMDFPIIRETIDIPTVESEMLENNIGYIQITDFDSVTYNQFMEALEGLEEQNQQGLILDLRNNPGGLLHIVEAIADEMLSEGLIVYTEDKHGNREELRSDGSRSFDKPLVVLINQYSASASEILAGAIKDHEVGTLVGTTTFGKGLVQRPFPVGDGSGLKLTVSKYFTPNGHYIQDVGIEPDVTVEVPEELRNQLTFERDEDVQLHKALEIINDQLN
ncbi:carboxyl-terminal processing protease [Natranaerovirga hydrolytica]|uniref:Carboxyl-terminal processing protease n=1 Tax=Natranaerovirga hydrolytica TaxID=680378 RepID=A0A4R1MNF0_9FIRM|nr:S41 family peptidase [Natranaerovirga hydrolytica]TCK93472.1 carboxyl-terminal processing protease [Natranaerovirga hydrolytica]